MKNLQLSDYIIIGLIVLLVGLGGFLGLKHKKVSGLPETVDKKVFFQVMIRGASITDNVLPFQNGEEAFITIRNVPYTKLKINSFSFERRRKAISANNENGLIIIEDPAMPFLYDFIINFEDNAKWTADGYVVGGNKLKIGVPITIEGAKYRLNGTVTNIKSAEEIMQMEQDIQQAQQQLEQQEVQQ